MDAQPPDHFELPLPVGARERRRDRERSSAEVNRDELEALRSAARVEGLSEGRRAGQEATAAALAEARALVAALDRARARLLTDERAEILAVVFASLRELVGELPDRQPQIVTSIVDRVIGTVERDRAMVIELAPLQAAYLREHWARSGPEEFSNGRWRIQDGADLGPADCRIRFENGYLDGRMDMRLSDIRAALLEHAAAAPEDADAPAD